ncbi:MAG: hypothetical protein WAX69_00965 [Victivallales bacterium]
MVVTPLCGNPEIPKRQWQREEHKAKAKLPEPQTEIGGTHSLLTPDKGQNPDDARSRTCASVNIQGTMPAISWITVERGA